jgi:hypothetical protein
MRRLLQGIGMLNRRQKLVLSLLLALILLTWLAVCLIVTGVLGP